MSLPIEFEKNMKRLLGNDFDKYLKSLDNEPKKAFRINKNYINETEFDRLFNIENKPLNNFPNYRQISTTEKLGNTVFHHAGMIYIQEPSSMLAVESLGVKNGDIVLDLCSAPGGKASQILEKNINGLVVCNEVVRSRANILFSNIERQGFKNSIITSLQPEKLASSLPNFFDKILVDAPCSGEGMFRKDAATQNEWNEGLPKFNHERQMQILKSADLMLKEGGSLVYSTCTFNLEENENTVLSFAKECGYEICELPLKVQEVTSRGFVFNGETETIKCGRCFPFSGFGEGQFIALLKKNTPNLTITDVKMQKKDSVNRQVLELSRFFTKECLDRNDFNYRQIGNNVYIIEKDIPYIKDGVVSEGVMLGSVEKNRLVPSHQFFKAYGKMFKNAVNLDLEDKRVDLYISGNEIEVENPNGYICILVNNVPIGGGKVVNGRVKNYYPKGLRK